MTLGTRAGYSGQRSHSGGQAPRRSRAVAEIPSRDAMYATGAGEVTCTCDIPGMAVVKNAPLIEGK